MTAAENARVRRGKGRGGGQFLPKPVAAMPSEGQPMTTTTSASDRDREIEMLWAIKDAESTDAINAICERRLKELGAWSSGRPEEDVDYYSGARNDPASASSGTDGR